MSLVIARRATTRMVHVITKMVRQFAYEAHGVGKHGDGVRGQGSPAQLRVQGGEETILGWSSSLGELIEERRLARIGVTGQGDLQHIATTTPLDLASALDFFQVPFQLADSLAQHSAVGFQLRLTFATPNADTTHLT